MSSADENRGAGALTAEELDRLVSAAWPDLPRRPGPGLDEARRVVRLIAAARAATTTAPPVVEPDAWTYRFRNGGEVLWTFTRKTIEEVKLATRGEHEDRFEFAPLYLAEAGGDGLRAIPQPGPMPPYSFQDDPSLRASTGQVALSARPAKQPVERGWVDITVSELAAAMFMPEDCPSASHTAALSACNAIARRRWEERANGVEGDRG